VLRLSGFSFGGLAASLSHVPVIHPAVFTLVSRRFISHFNAVSRCFRDYNLCEGCFEKRCHKHHAFVKRERKGSPWQAAPRAATAAIDPRYPLTSAAAGSTQLGGGTTEAQAEIAAQLQSIAQERELTTEDYDLLLQVPYQPRFNPISTPF